MTRCQNPMCSKLLDPRTAKNRGERLFCDTRCLDEWERQNNLFTFAAQGGPVDTRRPTKDRKWWQR